MRVFFINGNPYKPAVPPIGLEYVCEATLNAGHEATIYDFSLMEETGLETAVRTFSPDVIGITLRNMDTGHLFNNVSYIPELKKLIAGIKIYFKGPIVLGGAGFSLLPEEILRTVEADYGVIGEGDVYFPQLLENLSHPENVPNIVIRNRTTQTITATKKETLKHCPPQLKRGTVDHSNYYKMFSKYPGHSLANIQTKRGCNKSCTYCAEPDVIGRTIIKRDPNDIVSEIKEFIKKGIVDQFFFVDSEFNVCPDHAAEVCEALLANNIQIRWSCYLTPENTDKRLISLMNRAGCENMFWSMESASDPVLQGLGKNYNAADVMRITNTCDELNQTYTILLMFGGPDETEHTVKETWENLRNAKNANFGIVTGVRIYPSTQMAQTALKDGIIASENELLAPTFYRKEYTINVIFPAVEKHFGSMKNCVILGPERKTKFN